LGAFEFRTGALSSAEAEVQSVMNPIDLGQLRLRAAVNLRGNNPQVPQAVAPVDTDREVSARYFYGGPP
jgi:hypothetical protein